MALKVFPTRKQGEVLLINTWKWQDGASLHPFPFLLNLTIILTQEISERNVGGSRAWKLRASFQSLTSGAGVQPAMLSLFRGGWSQLIEWWCAPGWKPVAALPRILIPSPAPSPPPPPPLSLLFPLPFLSPPLPHSVSERAQLLSGVFGSLFTYSVLFSLCCDKHLAKQGRKGVFQLTAPVHHSGSHRAGAGQIVWSVHPWRLRCRE